MKWIKIEDELPNKDKYDWVLVLTKLVPEDSYSVPAVAELRFDDTWYFRDEEKPAEETFGIKITHWMPLPINP